MRRSSSSEENVISIFKKKVTVASIKRKSLPTLIPQAGLTAERKKYLYEEIRPFVSPCYQIKHLNSSTYRMHCMQVVVRIMHS